jgi:hypothetical protein
LPANNRKNYPLLAERFHQELAKPATNPLGPIIAITTRGAGITAAAYAELFSELIFFFD